jgi:hypothetical protein
VNGLVRGRLHAFEEKAHPGFPVTGSSHFTEESVIFSPVTLKEET